MTPVICGTKEKKEKRSSDREQIGGFQRQRVGNMGEGGQRAQTFSCKINESPGCNVQHGNWS